ncbi:MAG TPA: hypothetical protein VK960_07970 [Acidimicrobiia bacterium]|nr:hypothetical protein [Acidimicrobiia bacterium]
MLHDTRMVRALMDETAAAVPAPRAHDRTSPLRRGRLGLARWMVRTGAKLQGAKAIAVPETRVVVLDPCAETATELPQAA